MSLTLTQGLGIRFLQQRGEHRRKPKSHGANAEDEMWKRVFWYALIFFSLFPRQFYVGHSFFWSELYASFSEGQWGCMSRSTLLLLPGTSSDQFRYDLELPLQVDDEYWDIGFIQPLGKPSQLSYFVYQLRLCEVIMPDPSPIYVF
jgi:hypothetical protein